VTEEEVEKIVSEAVDRRVAILVAQMGRDLEERYVRRDEIAGLVDLHVAATLKTIGANLERQLEQLGEASRTGGPLPDGVVGAVAEVIRQILEEISEVRVRTLEIGMYLMADGAKVPRGPEALEKVMKLSRIKSTVLRNERQRLRKQFEMASKVDPEVSRLGREMLDLLGEPSDEESAKTVN
jgi:hypothetical protein